jgi:hypothetical protein
MVEATEGWLPTSDHSQWHYFGPTGYSLCGKQINFNRISREQEPDDLPDFCAECQRRLAERQRQGGKR